ncbi:MAG: GDP-L-fucose synthase [Elusimicrobiota bacterium]
MNKYSKVYIAGHRGLVGSNIFEFLKEKGYTNLIYSTSKDLDLTRQKDTEDFFEKNKPEYVILAAARVGGILANSTYPAQFIYDNLAISLNIIHSAYKYGVKKLLNLGSSCIYPKLAPQPLKEEYLLSGYLEPTNEAYAVAKIAAIKLCRYYNAQYGTNFISVMPTNLYGKGDKYNLETSHVLPALIRKFHLANLLSKRDFDGIVRDLKKNPIGFGLDKEINYNSEKSIVKVLNSIGVYSDYVLIWGTGKVYREFLHVRDMVRACVFIMENYDYKDIGELINIGSGEDIMLKDLAEMIRRIVGFNGEIRYDTTKPDGTPKKLLDVSKLKGLGWKPEITLEEGIKQSYKEYLELLNK